MQSLSFSLSRRALKYDKFVSAQLAPFLRSCHPQTLNWISKSSPQLRRYLLNPQQHPPANSTSLHTIALREVIRNSTREGDLSSALQSVCWLDRVVARVERIPSKSLVDQRFAFDVGDVVVNQRLGHLGVVAATLPICFESNEWVCQHLGTIDDPRMASPWYLVLVGRHEGVPQDFSRYGSEKTHIKITGSKSIGLNRHLPLYFKAFDSATGRYVPRIGVEAFNEKKHVPERNKRSVDATIINFAGCGSPTSQTTTVR